MYHKVKLYLKKFLCLSTPYIGKSFIPFLSDEVQCFNPLWRTEVENKALPEIYMQRISQLGSDCNKHLDTAARGDAVLQLCMPAFYKSLYFQAP